MAATSIPRDALSRLPGGQDRSKAYLVCSLVTCSYKAVGDPNLAGCRILQLSLSFFSKKNQLFPEKVCVCAWGGGGGTHFPPSPIPCRCTHGSHPPPLHTRASLPSALPLALPFEGRTPPPLKMRELYEALAPRAIIIMGFFS